MITYLDLAIPVYVAGAAIFLVPTLVFDSGKWGSRISLWWKEIYAILTSGPIHLCLES